MKRWAPVPRGVSGILALSFLLVSCDGRSPGTTPPSKPPVGPNASTATRVAQGLSSPVDLTAPPGDTLRVFVVEKTGRIRILKSGAILPRPFLDVSARVSGGSEQGLLGLAFHPGFNSNRKYYVYYTDRAGDTRVVEFQASAVDPDTSGGTEREVLFVDQPASNHNGGQLAFGPDGYLYIGLGDGGGANDQFGNGQNLGTLLGSLLRIDVDSGNPYAVPATNPFAGRAGARTEIWDYGLRNPWRFSFDRASGDLYIADVGQNLWEEIDFEPAGSGGRNYGWNVMEGLHCFGATTCDTTGLTLPVVEYGHGEGYSVTGGYVYRGSAITGLDGTYFYGDYGTGLIRSFRVAGGRAMDPRDWTAALRTAGGGAMTELSSFGQDARGELYLLRLGGEIYRIDPRP